MNNQTQKTLELQKLMRDPAAILALLAENKQFREDPAMRAVRSLRSDCTDLMAERDQLKAENEALRKALLEASEEIYAWGSYASDYFQEKHDLHGCVKKFHAAAISKGEQP